MRLGRFLLFGLLAQSVAGTVSASTITFSQSDWPGGALTISTFGAFSTGGGLTDEPSGGNPGSYVTVYADHSAVPTGGQYFIWTGVEVAAWVYDPAVSGAITSLDFSGDVLWLNPSRAAFIAFVEQGGNYYFAGGVESGNTTWIHSARTGASQFNFGLVNTTTGFWSFSLHPDFSASGAPITFGYAIGTNNTANVGTLPLGRDFISFDNIVYVIHNASTVPEPTTTLLLGIGLVRVAARRRRQST